MSKEKVSVIGFNEVEHKRFMSAIDSKFKKTIKDYKSRQVQIPLEIERVEKVILWLEEQLELNKDDENKKWLVQFLSSNVNYYKSEYLVILKDQLEELSSFTENVEKTEEFLKYLEQFVSFDTEKSVVSYEKNNDALKTFMFLVDILDLDDKIKNNQKQKQSAKKEVKK